MPKTVFLPADLVARINAYRHQHYYRFEVQAISRLLMAGLDAEAQRHGGMPQESRMVAAE